MSRTALTFLPRALSAAFRPARVASNHHRVPLRAKTIASSASASSPSNPNPNHDVSTSIAMELKSANKAHGGEVRKYAHASSSTGTDMTFSVYVPPAAALSPVPVIYYLSGLTCTDDNATQKGGAFKAAVRLLPVRPRSRGARRSLRTFPVVTLHPRFPFNV